MAVVVVSESGKVVVSELDCCATLIIIVVGSVVVSMFACVCVETVISSIDRLEGVLSVLDFNSASESVVSVLVCVVVLIFSSSPSVNLMRIPSSLSPTFLICSCKLVRNCDSCWVTWSA